MGLGLILDSTKDDEPDPYTRGYGGYLVSDPICFFLKITFSSILFVYVLNFYKGETRLPIFKPPNGGSGGHLDQPSHVRSLT
ncbi:unnamed protein product [Brassica napus]|uniref:(rape) hypothetical protein n=1 Tax=Brassica napus TaxID=3708 RepID=A0A816MWY2_BRANA|nr:unnamed protein product [Brassica napus]